jgi:hypothetical protein
MESDYPIFDVRFSIFDSGDSRAATSPTTSNWAMARNLVEPWIPPAQPTLGRLAMEAADESDQTDVRGWPEVHGNGVRFSDLPTFLCWIGGENGHHHLVLLQARELGAIIPGAKPSGLPEGWLTSLDLEALARPLRRHPAFPGGAAVHVVQVVGPGQARVRSVGELAAPILAEVLTRLTGIDSWAIRPGSAS